MFKLIGTVRKIGITIGKGIGTEIEIITGGIEKETMIDIGIGIAASLGVERENEKEKEREKEIIGMYGAFLLMWRLTLFLFL